MKSSLWSLLSLTVLLSACTVEQHYYFREDFSGTYQMRIDMSSMAAMGGDSLGTDTLFSDAQLQEMSDGYSSVPGISEANSTYQDNVLQSGFSFDGLTSLNSALKGNAEDSSDSPALYTFTRKGKKLSMKLNRTDLEMGEDEQMQGMDEMLSFALTLKFEKPVKSVKGVPATLDKESNTVSIEFPLKDYSDPKKNLDVEIKFR